MITTGLDLRPFFSRARSETRTEPKNLRFKLTDRATIAQSRDLLTNLSEFTVQLFELNPNGAGQLKIPVTSQSTAEEVDGPFGRGDKIKLPGEMGVDKARKPIVRWVPSVELKPVFRGMEFTLIGD
jgi:hypothetical protein